MMVLILREHVAGVFYKTEVAIMHPRMHTVCTHTIYASVRSSIHAMHTVVSDCALHARLRPLLWGAEY